MTGKGKKAAERRRRQAAAKARARRRRIATWSIVGVAVIAVVVLALNDPLPPELAAVEQFDNIGRNHLAEGETPPQYNSSPATSGDHAASPAPCGIYLEEMPDQIQVHNLEHGAVMIQYQPDLPEEAVDDIHLFARGKSSHIVVAPRTDLDDAVVVTSWTRMLRLDSADIPTIDAYFDRFAFSGPEVGVPCPFQVDQAS